MKSPLLSLVLGALLAVSVAHAQSPSGPSARRPAVPELRLPPIPPGVPTTASNVHLPTEAEIKLGREGIAEVERVYKVASSGPYHERLQRVARDVVRASQSQGLVEEYLKIYNLPRWEDKSRRVPFEYRFQVLDTRKEVNAFSLPGGPIYVTKGLMDYATSDHELAAVLAHEVIHVCNHHAEHLIRKSRKLSAPQMWALLAAVLAGAAGGGAGAAAAGNILMASQSIAVATLNGYGQELETEADRMGVKLLTQTQYHPLGMYTFLQKLARDDRLRGNPDYGIYQSHPYTNQRVKTVREDVAALGYRIDSSIERQVSGSFRLDVAPHQHQGKEAAELRLNGALLFTAVAPEGDLTPGDRARKM
ncbi:MAG: hypothetical protein FJX77_03825, partial [Armatimonadetes bacterium]|nr:hypothetical protein [Armatimonadota bacterium]